MLPPNRYSMTTTLSLPTQTDRLCERKSLANKVETAGGDLYEIMGGEKITDRLCRGMATPWGGIGWSSRSLSPKGSWREGRSGEGFGDLPEEAPCEIPSRRTRGTPSRATTRADPKWREKALSRVGRDVFPPLDGRKRGVASHLRSATTDQALEGASCLDDAVRGFAASPRMIARRFGGASGERKSGIVRSVRLGRPRNSTGHSVRRSSVT